MTTLLVSHRVAAARRADLERRAGAGGFPLEVVGLPQDREARIAEADAARIETAYFSIDVNPHHARQFFSAVRKAPRLKWMHLFNVGVDHPIFREMLGRGVRLTTSAGTSARPIAHNAITGLLMLARDFPRWLGDQRAHKWNPPRPPDVPRDLAGQTAVVVGLGHIGREIARLAQALGLKVIGVRRSPRRPDDPVDALCAPHELAGILPHADWLILACPLTPETRGLVNAGLISRLPPHARLINIARGEIVDEPALVEALRGGRLAGAYLDVFQQEPLPENSPLWDLPNVLVTPHNSSFDASLDDRIYAVFVENLARWHRGEPLLNEVDTTGGSP
jgi:phosphoglycerate dehydrogenase-like enzyme